MLYSFVPYNRRESTHGEVMPIRVRVREHTRGGHAGEALQA